MKIALLGYGKMGKAIEQIALSRGHEIVLIKDSKTSFEGLEKAQVAIDFSLPSTAFENITTALKAGVPVISGTTGWLEQYPQVVALAKDLNGAFIYGSNFSLGVNLFFKLNEALAKLMHNFSQYTAELEEIHHTQKLDAPSGTAISLAKQIINDSTYAQWQLGATEGSTLGIQAKRIDAVPGTHTVSYHSQIDSIEIKHTAHSREGFAQGAVIAAEWIIGKKGIFTMQDVLGL